MIKYVGIYLIAINLTAFLCYGIDKEKAKRHKYRISEFMLLCLAFIGGSPGALLGMLLFHHKTKHIKFVVLVPLFLALHILAALFLWWKGYFIVTTMTGQT